jgi:surface antigen
MKKPFARLDARTVDEQIEQVFQVSQDQQGAVDAHYIQDIHYMYRKEQILARARQRLMLVGESATAPPLDGQLHQADAAIGQVRQSGNSESREQTSRPRGISVLPGMFANDARATAPQERINLNSEMKKRAFAPFSSRSRIQRRLLVGVSAALTLVVVMAFALLAVSSLGRNVSSGSGSQPASGHHKETPGTGASASATALIQQQHDGYDPNSNSNVTISNGQESLSWPVGQSTYWANSRYHQLTGYWVQWKGNADQWVTGAREAGWNVSTSPHVSAIIVLMPYVQGAGAYGHVAVVESIVNSSTVHSSNMNWVQNGGGWNKVSYANFTVGPGVYFIWHK